MAQVTVQASSIKLPPRLRAGRASVKNPRMIDLVVVLFLET